ncbi:hypothetical protein LA345_40825 (plasmid) [Burkholderia vietnamiensis]|uniref:Uncharacterized protein n=1 Tax=Burkholderia vietnamiensis (strain G4 / LMG 22486) TaxID=269482 RepID=A4JTU7_BURVG|nr:hypothetical protein Bcep1808_6813 [Burkholderia vietnamiensis G4]MCB4350141.1 hypothetical protein [Burkholderia vietnamiensis]
MSNQEHQNLPQRRSFVLQVRVCTESAVSPDSIGAAIQTLLDVGIADAHSTLEDKEGGDQDAARLATDLEFGPIEVCSAVKPLGALPADIGLSDQEVVDGAERMARVLLKAWGFKFSGESVRSSKNPRCSSAWSVVSAMLEEFNGTDLVSAVDACEPAKTPAKDLDAKREVAQSQFEAYDFGTGVMVHGHDLWETGDARDFTKIAYLEYPEDEPDTDSHKATFHVRFDDQGNFSEAYALEVASGNMIGVRIAHP